MLQGWSYVGDRLLSAVIPYEETGWYDGQMWVKPPEVSTYCVLFFLSCQERSKGTIQDTSMKECEHVHERIYWHLLNSIVQYKVS